MSLGGLPPITTGTGTQQHREGYPIGAFFYQRVVSASLDPAGKVVSPMCDNGAGGVVACAQAPLVFWGRPTPKWEASFGSTLTLHHNLKLYGLVDLKTGHMIENGDIEASHTAFRNSLQIYQGTDPILAAYDQLGLVSGAGFQKAGFAKLRELSVVYTLPERWARKIGGSRASVTVAGRNLAILWLQQDNIFGRKVIDPEVRFGNPEVTAYGQTVLPQMASFMTTVRITF